MSTDGPPPTASTRHAQPLHDGSAITEVELTITGDSSGVVLRIGEPTIAQRLLVAVGRRQAECPMCRHPVEGTMRIYD